MHQPSSFRVLIESAPPNLGDRTSKDVHKNWPQLRSLPRVSGINLTQKRKCKPNCICRMSAAEVICLGTTTSTVPLGFARLTLFVALKFSHLNSSVLPSVIVKVLPRPRSNS